MRQSVNSPNLGLALQHSHIVREHLAKECERGHTASPYAAPTCRTFHTSGLGVVAKATGRHRLFVHLSAPAGVSVNDFIDIVGSSQCHM